MIEVGTNLNIARLIEITTSNVGHYSLADRDSLTQRDDCFSLQLELGGMEILSQAAEEGIEDGIPTRALTKFESVAGLACLLEEINRLGARDVLVSDLSPEAVAQLTQDYVSKQPLVSVQDGAMIRANEFIIEAFKI